MHYVIGLLIIIVLLLIFGPWLLVAIGLVLGALLVAIVWLVKHVVIPVVIVAAVIAAIVAVAFVALLIWAKANEALISRAARKHDGHPPVQP